MTAWLHCYGDRQTDRLMYAQTQPLGLFEFPLLGTYKGIIIDF